MTISKIKRVILVLSGKGGVGKSTFSAQLAFALAKSKRRVGLLDIDICGPSIPLMLGLKGQEVKQSASGWQPVYVDIDADGEDDQEAAGDELEEQGELGVMSIGFLMPDPDSAVIWRGPKKNGLIQQFFTSVDWGTLDYLIVDTPPGTSDEHISIVQMLKESLKESDGAIVVTTPQEVAMMDVRKELSFCKQTSLKVLGVVENMSTSRVDFEDLRFVDKSSGDDSTEKVLQKIKQACPEIFSNNSLEVSLFPAADGGPKAMAKRYGVPFLGSLPVDPELQKAGELGQALCKGKSVGKLKSIIAGILQEEKQTLRNGLSTEKQEENNTGTIIAENL